MAAIAADTPDVVATGVGMDPPVDEKEKLDGAQVERIMSDDGGPSKDFENYNRVDKEIHKYTTGERVYVDETESKRLRKMIDKRVLVVMIITYFLQAIDKGTISFASIMGIQEDLGLEVEKNDKYSWLTTAIYIAILIVEYPINWLIQRVPIAKFLGIAIMVWGMVLALHAATSNFAGILTCRVILGIAEAVCQPSFLILSSMWYKRSEQAQVVTYWYMMNGAQQIVGGILAYCFSLIPASAPIKSWQVLFMVYGVLSVLWGAFVFFWMPDSPMRAKCFSEEDKKKMIERVRSNETGLQNKKWRKDHIIEAFKDPQTYCYCLIQICTTLPTSGLGGFANIIINGFGFTILETQLLAMVLGAYIIIVLLSATWLVNKTHQNLIVMGVYVIPSFVGTIVLMTVENTSTATEAGLLISYYICLSFWAAQTLGMSMLSRNVGGQTKKSVVVSMNFISWAAGNAIGPKVFLHEDAPRYFIAFSTHMGCYCLLILVIFFLRFWLARQNKLKDRLAAEGFGEAADQAHTHGFEDLTDQANPNFRYVF